MASAENRRLLALLLRLLCFLLPCAMVKGQFSAELLAESDPRRCLDSFDGALKKQCMRGEWEQKYYFDADSRECRLFWYDGCPGLTGSRNFFDFLLECQWICEPSHTQRSSICLEPFDEHLRDECGESENWRRHFYFDRSQRRCLPFWFDGCASRSGNHFEDEISCRKKCESASAENSEIHYKNNQTNYVPAWRLISTTLRGPISGTKEGEENAKTKQKMQWNWPQLRQKEEEEANPTTKQGQMNSFLRFSSARHPSDAPSVPPPFRKSALSTAVASSPTRPSTSVPLSPSSSSFPPKNVCARENPCQNGGTCVYDVLMEQSICKCATPFTNDFCTERIDFDPCSPNPCQNGATCSAIAGPKRTEFDCFCARGFAGQHCEFKPCEDNPCRNGGTCRTTRAKSLFFCACPPGWGGKTCMIGNFSSNGLILENDGKTAHLENANLTRQLSSGKVEWIEELKRVTPIMPKSEESVGKRQSNAVGIGKSAVANSPRHRPVTVSAVSVVGFPRDQIVVQELPTRTLKGTTVMAATNDAKMGKKWTDGRGQRNSVPQQMLAICSALIISFYL